MRGCILRSILKNQGGYPHYVHFFDAELAVEIFEKQGPAGKKGVEIRDMYRHFCTLILTVKENFMQSLFAISRSFCDQKKVVKALLTSTFIP